MLIWTILNLIQPVFSARIEFEFREKLILREILVFSVHQHSHADGMTSKGITLLTETLMDLIQPVVMGEIQSECRRKSLLIARLGIFAYQASDARKKIGEVSTEMLLKLRVC